MGELISTIYLRFFDLDALPVCDRGAILSDEEEMRASRLLSDTDRDRWRKAHAELRRFLGKTLACDPKSLVFEVGPEGKPFLPAFSGWQFSLSHARGYAMMAAVHGRKIGVDLEKIRVVEGLEDLARRHFSTREFEALMQKSVEERSRFFFECWTAREAVAKCLGIGVLGLSGQHFLQNKANPTRFWRVRSDEGIVFPVIVGEGFRAAIALNGMGQAQVILDECDQND